MISCAHRGRKKLSERVEGERYKEQKVINELNNHMLSAYQNVRGPLS
jgi:hypothetical protein